MTDFTQRRPVVSLLLLLLLNLFLLSVQVRDEQGRLLLRVLGIALFSPPANALNFVVRQTRDGFGRFLWLWKAEKRNRKLERENARLKLELQQLRALEGMVRRTESFQRMRDQYSFEVVMASVIWRNAPLYSHHILINVGSRDGVSKDAAVIAPEGVVGRVVVVTPFDAEVELLTDQTAAAGVLLLKSRLQGIVQGTGAKQLRLSFIPSSEPLADGELVYTSGTDRVYPKGLPVGKVISAKKDGIYQKILVASEVDFQRLEEVMVVLRDN
jgi:rod shape-determining protein MreC